MIDIAGSAGLRTALPHPALRDLVHAYVGYRQHDVSLARHRGLPSPWVTLIVSLAGPVRIVDGVTAPTGVVGGLHLRPTLIDQAHEQCGVHVMLNPLGTRALLGAPPLDLIDVSVDLEDLPIPWGRGLATRLAEQRDWSAVFGVLDRTLLATRRQVTLLPEVAEAWRLLRVTSGTMPVARVARDVGWSRRHLAERFRGSLGVTPKQAGRLARFERSRTAIRAGADLATVAAECGFFDQAHLTNEWRAMAGLTPTAWIREELPFLQDAPDDD
ncbi:helix-turn-helix domain-containing protein [Spiractinospora alimapuensis]|uniref:helix-turn-helix domain-containing protein n=1 Tax=Spiractinospora alimapuensis TaxID=2820884 RepID=UPI001F2C1636|nr:helix-turn-helix domain-containing protein [Spiractinospora alimapuensis]